MSLSEFIFVIETTRLLERNPTASVDQLRSDIEENLISTGLRKEVIDQLTYKYFKDERISKIFKFKAVINPIFLYKKTGKKFWFFLVDARYGRYLPLIAITGRWEGDLSRYVIYGSQDTLFRLHGTEEEARTISGALRDANYVFEPIEVEDIPYFYKYNVTEQTKGSASESVLKKLVLNYRDKDVPDEVKKDLLDKNVLLGVAIVEDLSVTNRIKAFVGITFIGSVSPEFRKDFLHNLLSIALVKKCLLSVYKCKGASFNYFLEFVVGRHKDLDEITDSIAKMLSRNIETSTFIVAKAAERLPMFSKKDSLNLQGIPYEGYIEYVKDVESRFVPRLNRDETLSYAKLSPKERHLLISIMGPLTEFNLDILEETDRELVEESIINFALASILKDRPKLHSSVDLSYTAIQKICRNTLERLVNLFYMGNFKMAQAKIPLPKKNVWKFTLGECYSSLKNWNDSSFSDLFTFPEDVLTLLLKFISVRNPISHGELPDSWIEDFELMSKTVGEGLTNGLSSAIWLKKNVIEQREWVIPIEEALKLSENIFETSEQTGKKLEEVLESTKKTQEISQQTSELLTLMFTDFNKTKKSLLRKLGDIEKSQKKNAELVLDKIIAAVENGDTQKLNGLLSMIVKNSNEIIQNSDKTPSSRGRVAWLVELVKKTAYSLPAETSGNILAQIILNGGAKSLPMLIGILSSIL